MSSDGSRVERLEARIERLEVAVRELQEAVERNDVGPASGSAQGGDGSRSTPQDETPEEGAESSPSAAATPDASPAPSPAPQQDVASMAVIGTAGGLGTPFLLYTDVGGVAGLTVYTCIVLGGAMAIYLYRGWRSLLYTAVIGGWGVLLVPCGEAALTNTLPLGAGVLQGGVVVAWLVLGGVPVLRAVLRRRAPDRWSVPVTSVATWHRAVFGRRPAYGLVPASPFAALWASRLLWSGSDLLWASVAGGGALYGAIYLALRRESLLRYAPPHGLVAAVLGTYALSEVLGGATLSPGRSRRPCSSGSPIGSTIACFGSPGTLSLGLSPPGSGSGSGR